MAYLPYIGSSTSPQSQSPNTKPSSEEGEGGGGGGGGADNKIEKTDSWFGRLNSIF